MINTPIVDEAVIRGELADRAERIRSFYRKRGASPDVVAEAAVDAVLKRRLIQRVPRLHVDPQWVLKRISPRASQALSRGVQRLIAR